MATGTYAYTRITPPATTGSTADSLVGLIPSPANNDTLTKPLILEFTPTFEDGKILFPDVAAVQGTNKLLKGFNTPGNRNSGGGGEVRRFPIGTTDFSASNGIPIPCTVDYAPGFSPDQLAENPGGKIRWAITPVTPAVPGQSLWPPDYEIVEDMTKVYTTASVSL